MPVEEDSRDKDRVVFIQMFAVLEAFFQSAIGHLFRNKEQTGLFGYEFKHFDDELGPDFFKFFEVFGEFDVGVLEEFDGDREVGLFLVALPD